MFESKRLGRLLLAPFSLWAAIFVVLPLFFVLYHGLNWQIYDLQNQNCEYEYRFKSIRLAADLRIPATRSSCHDGAPMPWKTKDQTHVATPPPTPKEEN